jgi:exonuclease III
MKVISWNCHQSFRTKAERVLALKPDLLVLPECEEPSKLSAKGVHFHDAYWVGKNKHKGLGILTFNGWNIEALEEVSPRIPYVIPVRIQKEDFSFILWAVWSQKPMSHSNYGVRMWKALSSYSAHLSEDRIIIAGDFNSSSIWDRKGRKSNHTNIVKALHEYGIKSAYHEHFAEEQGQESQATLFFTYNEEKPFHIDYCFASEWFCQRLRSMTLGESKDWLEDSDHMPLIMDFEGV